jgi:hypothetical protein
LSLLMSSIADQREPRMAAPFYLEGAPHTFRRHGQDWVLMRGSWVVARVVRDDHWPIMWRALLAGGRRSNMTTLAGPKDAAIGFLGRVDAYEHHRLPTFPSAAE